VRDVAGQHLHAEAGDESKGVSSSTYGHFSSGIQTTRRAGARRLLGAPTSARTQSARSVPRPRI
jgi:hypothetical protein